MRAWKLGATFTGALTAGMLVAAFAWAQTASTVRIRGRIAAMEPHSLTISERSGQTQTIALDEPVTVTTVKPEPLESIQPGSYIGVTARPAADGSLVALEVHVFPEMMRGAGEGHRPWDLQPGATMTNANVSGVVGSTSGPEVTLKYKDGTQTVRIPPNTPIVTFAPAERADLKVGAPVFITAATKDGGLHAARVTVGTNGVAPPM
jgi:Domain of unknown function (DUF5666)